MKKVIVNISLKESVLDPQGKAIKDSLKSLGYASVADVRVGKSIELMVEEHENIEAQVREMCDKLLANPVIEDYRIAIEEA